MAVTLTEAKAHLRIVHDADDAYITGLIEVARDYVSATGTATAAPVPPAVRHAILLLVSHFFESRDAATEKPSQAVQFGVDALLAPYREHAI